MDGPTLGGVIAKLPDCLWSICRPWAEMVMVAGVPATRHPYNVHCDGDRVVFSGWKMPPGGDREARQHRR